MIPEMPRTKHIGGGGVHVTGYEQELFYNTRPLCKVPNAEIHLERKWSKAYALDIMRFIEHATVLNITDDACPNPPLQIDVV